MLREKVSYKIICLLLLVTVFHPNQHVRASPARLSSLKNSEKSTAKASSRSDRSIWPFTSSSSSTPEKERLDFFLGGDTVLPKELDLQGHPIWRVHKYQGIDLRPVELILPSNSTFNDEPQVANIPTELPVNEQPPPFQDLVSVSNETTEPPPDLSFLDDLGGLAYFLPEPKEESAEEEDNEAIQPVSTGFFSSIWSKFRGQSVETSATTLPGENKSTTSSPGFLSSVFNFGSASNEGELEGGNEEEDSTEELVFYLPETKGSYVAVRVPENQLESGFLPSFGPPAVVDSQNVPLVISEIEAESGDPSKEDGEEEYIISDVIWKLGNENLPMREAVDFHGKQSRGVTGKANRFVSEAAKGKRDTAEVNTTESDGMGIENARKLALKDIGREKYDGYSKVRRSGVEWR